MPDFRVSLPPFRGLDLGQSVSQVEGSGDGKGGKRFGCLRIYACSASMAILNIARGELIDEVDASLGMVGFMDLVREADLTLYI